MMSACANKQIRLAVDTSKQLNQGDSGIALPLVVRVYQLKNKDRMEQADFQSLWKNDQDVLGDDLVDRREFTLHPNSKKLIEIDRIEGAEYVAIMGLFRRPDEQNKWREIRLLKGWGLWRRLMKLEAFDRKVEVVEY